LQFCSHTAAHKAQLLPVKATFVVTLKSNLRPIPLSLPRRGYEKSCCCFWSQDSLLGKTIIAKARKIENFEKKQPENFVCKILIIEGCGFFSQNIRKYVRRQHLISTLNTLSQKF
jgi:hypothetical protein